MIKTNILAGITAVIFGVVLSSAPVFADEVAPISYNPADDTTTQPVTTSEEPNDTTGAGEISEPSDAPVTDCVDGDLNDTDCLKPEPIINEIESSDECATEDENCQEAATEPEVWPMYLSLGALGAAVLIFIILNLFSNKKKK